MMKYIIDRFEHGFAIVEDEHGEMSDVPKDLIPETAKEGDCLFLVDDGSYAVDETAYNERSESVSKLIDDLFV